MTLALVLAAVALVVSVAALAVALAVGRQSGVVSVVLNRHRLGHELREGRKDPAPDRERRRLNLGPPRETGERRNPNRAPLAADEHPTTVEMRRLPRPGSIR